MMVLGDDFAVGVGDSLWPFRPAGIVSPLMEECYHEPSIRQSWQIVQRGVLGSRCITWAPSTTDHDRSDEAIARGKKAGLSHPKGHTLPEKDTAETSIYLVMLGANDILRYLFVTKGSMIGS